MNSNSGNFFSKQYILSLSLALVGGFLEAYTYVTRDGVFANAQTGNVARAGIYIAKGDVAQVVRYLIPVVIFVTGILLAADIKRKFDENSAVLHWSQIITFAEMVMLFVVGLIPRDKYSVLATAIISFVCSMQVESFREFDGNMFASTMCTGNLRKATEHLHKYIAGKQTKDRMLAIKFYLIDIVFMIGVVIGYKTTELFWCKAVWLTEIVLLPILIVCSISGGYIGLMNKK